MDWKAFLPNTQFPLHGQQPLALEAMNVWSEARGEPWEGQCAVAWVVKNRAARHPRWPASTKEVIVQPWQFSWTMDQNCLTRVLYLSGSPAVQTYRIALAAAFVVGEGVYPDPTGGADHYYAPKTVTPSWAGSPKMEVLVHIGNHLFLREKHG